MTDAALDPEGVEYSAITSWPVRMGAHATALALLTVGFGPSWQLLVFALMSVFLIEAAIIDLESLRLPNVLLGIPFLVGLGALPAITVAFDVGSIGGAIGGAAAGFFGMLVLHLVYPAGLGLGDVKLAAVMGLYLGWLGWNAVGLAFVAAILLLGLCSGYLIWRDDHGSSALPFGPFLVLAAVLSAAVYAV
ncbi:MAG: A24 family peptidase [Acidimicrobiia bacterium]|nr:A24 family peptidase [Acidimicrobiia bacterium]MDH5236744.1 A24 family peptidase [Acidimicrobiia bacterium]